MEPGKVEDTNKFISFLFLQVPDGEIRNLWCALFVAADRPKWRGNRTG